MRAAANQCHVAAGRGKSYLFLGRCAEDLDDLDELINAALTREKRSAQKQLCHHAAHRPNVYGNVSEIRHCIEIVPIADVYVVEPKISSGAR